MASKRSKQSRGPHRDRVDRPRDEAVVRIVGGQFRGRKLLYSGEERTRPMKDRVREALFNLVGPDVKGMHAIDLFAGTGALGLEAVSRGAARASLIERHYPTAQLVRRNVEALGVPDRCETFAADAFLWLKCHQPAAGLPWLVLCSPPFDLYTSRGEEMMKLIEVFVQCSPAGSIIVAEVPDTFEVAGLPDAAAWQTRRYPLVQLALYRTPPRH